MMMSAATPTMSSMIKSCNQWSDSHASGETPPLPARSNSRSTQLAKPFSQLSIPFTTVSAKLFAAIVSSVIHHSMPDVASRRTLTLAGSNSSAMPG